MRTSRSPRSLVTALAVAALPPAAALAQSSPSMPHARDWTLTVKAGVIEVKNTF